MRLIKGRTDQLVVSFTGLCRGQDAWHNFSYFTRMGKKGLESISVCQVVMDLGPVCIICELYLDITEKVLLSPSDTKSNLLNITPARDCNRTSALRTRSINSSSCYILSSKSETNPCFSFNSLPSMSAPHPMIDGGKERIQAGGDTWRGVCGGSAGMRDVTDTHNTTEEAECWGCVYLFCVLVSVVLVSDLRCQGRR